MHDCRYEQCRYNVNQRCGVDYVSDKSIQIPLYCSNTTCKKEKKD